MFEYMGWDEAADAILDGLSQTIQQKRVTYDFERNLADAELLKCSEFGQAVVENIR
jgi:isocitrate dehydrogenase